MCTAAELIADGTLNGYQGLLGNRMLLLALAGLFSQNAGNLTAQQALANGVQLQSLSDRMLDQALLQTLC